MRVVTQKKENHHGFRRKTRVRDDVDPIKGDALNYSNSDEYGMDIEVVFFLEWKGYVQTGGLAVKGPDH